MEAPALYLHTDHKQLKTKSRQRLQPWQGARSAAAASCDGKAAASVRAGAARRAADQRCALTPTFLSLPSPCLSVQSQQTRPQGRIKKAPPTKKAIASKRIEHLGTRTARITRVVETGERPKSAKRLPGSGVRSPTTLRGGRAPPPHQAHPPPRPKHSPSCCSAGTGKGPQNSRGNSRDSGESTERGEGPGTELGASCSLTSHLPQSHGRQHGANWADPALGSWRRSAGHPRAEEGGRAHRCKWAGASLRENRSLRLRSGPDWLRFSV